MNEALRGHAESGIALAIEIMPKSLENKILKF